MVGMSPQLLNFKSVEELKAMELELWDELREANEELNEARQYAIEFDDDEEGLVTSGLDGKNSDDEGDNEASDEIGIPDTTLQTFGSVKGLRNRNLSTANKDQWGKLFKDATPVAFHFHPHSNTLF
jgi:hypothetical protein